MLNFLIIAFVCFVLLASDTCIQSVSSQKHSQHIPIARAKLRGFGVGLHLLDIYEMRQTLKKVLLKYENDRRNKEMFEETEKRRRIYEKYLLNYQAGSSILRDFNTNRF